MPIDSMMLDEDNCQYLHICWQDSGHTELRWEMLSSEVKVVMRGCLSVNMPTGHGCGKGGTYEADFIEVDFDTPWSQPGEIVAVALSRKFDCDIKLWHAECGCDFCGYSRYKHRALVEAFCGSLEWEQADEDAYTEVIGPGWLMNNLTHFDG